MQLTASRMRNNESLLIHGQKKKSATEELGFDVIVTVQSHALNIKLTEVWADCLIINTRESCCMTAIVMMFI